MRKRQSFNNTDDTDNLNKMTYFNYYNYYIIFTIIVISKHKLTKNMKRINIDQSTHLLNNTDIK